MNIASEPRKISMAWKVLALCLISGFGLARPSFFQKHHDDQKDTSPFSEIGQLLSRLDLDLPGMENVKPPEIDSLQAAGELLKYFRSRESVKHPVDRRSRAGLFGKCASEIDLQVADDALKHIFLGQNAYPAYFCGHDINWGLKPVPDNEWVWQLNRMYFWSSMALAYWHTNDEKYAREWCFQLVDWIKKNPRDALHDYAWRSLEAGIRGFSWTRLFQYFLDSPYFTPDVLVAFLNSCHDHASYLMTKYYASINWSLQEAEGLAFIAMIFPEFKESKKWRAEAIARLNKEIVNQVYPDGHQRELSISYHLGTIAAFTRTYDLARMNGQQEAFPESYSKTIEKMCEVPMKLGLPDGTTTQFGDSWTGAPGHLWESLKSWARLYNREDFLYVATEGQEGKKPEAAAFALKESGFYSMRSGWDKNAICMVLKCGPDGAWHCQPDNGTFEVYAGGRHLMPDSGVYIYSGDPENRAWFRRTNVHQTLTLNGEDTAYAPKLLLWKPGKDRDVLVVENASYSNLTHRRAMLFVDNKFFIIVDEAFGDGTGNVDLHFQLAAGKAVFDKAKFSVRSGFPDGWNVLVQAASQTGLKLEEEEGQVSFVYTKKEPRPAFRYRVVKETKEEGVRFITIVAPYCGIRPEVSARIVGQPKPGTSPIDLEIVADGKVKRIRYDLSPPSQDVSAAKARQPNAQRLKTLG